MHCEIKYEGEISVTPAMAGDLWADILAISVDPSAFAEDGEAFLTVCCTFEGEQDDELHFFEASGFTIDDKPCPPPLVEFFEDQLRRQFRDEIDRFIVNWDEYRHWPLARALADNAGTVRHHREIEAKRRASLNTMGAL